MDTTTGERLLNLYRQAGWDPAECVTGSRLPGATNASFLCTYRGKKYACRLATETSGILAISRKAESAALKAVSELGCGAPLIYFDPDTGDMITAFIEGRAVTGEDYDDPAFIERTALLMKRLHGLKTEFVFDPFADIERKTAYIREKGVPLHERFGEVYDAYRRTAARCRGGEYTGLCHGDPFATNFILSDDGGLFLIDYEFAGMCDVFFDIACMIPWYTQENKELFLTAYFGRCDQAILGRVRDFNFVQILWNGTWSYVKSLDADTNGFDYVGFGHRHIGMLLDLLKDHPA